MDPLGCIIFIGSICCFLFALQWGGQTKPWKSATIIGLLVGAVGLAAMFIAIQWKLQERALIAPRVYKKRSIWTGAKVLFFVGASTYLVRSAAVNIAFFCYTNVSLRLFSSSPYSSKPHMAMVR